ncbi:MAG: hypothetical protein KIS87_03205 [Phycisphaeraceae bacterium]|nr:hypothetical protein [Phycisphaeraceae bacterium]
MERWRVISVRERARASSGEFRPTILSRIAAFVAIALVIGVGVLLLVPALFVGAVVFAIFAAVSMVRRAFAAIFVRDGRRNVRVIERP